MSKRWLILGLIVTALAGSGRAQAQFMPALPSPPPGAFGASGGAFGQAPTPRSGFGAGPGAFQPVGTTAFENLMPAPPPPEGGEAPCPDPGPLIPYRFPRTEEGVCPPDCSIWAEYLFLWQKGNRLAFPTLTEGLPNAVRPAAIGQEGTRVLIGDQGWGYGLTPAFRVGLTWWCLQPEHLALDLNFWYAATQTNYLFADVHSDDTGKVIARPFYNPNIRREDADPRAVPNLMAGTISQGFTTRMFGSEANLRWVAGSSETPTGGSSISLIAGIRQFRLDDQLEFADQTIQQPAAAHRTFNIVDNFNTFNQFYGGQVGTIIRCRWDERMTTSLVAKLAVGPNFQEIDVDGSTVILDGNGTILARDGFGLYTQPTNVGSFSHTTLAIMPEVGVNLAIDANEHIRFRFGYTFVWVNNIIRPGDQMDRHVNQQPLNLAPGFTGTVRRPNPPQFKETDFYYQFLNVGLELSF